MTSYLERLNELIDDTTVVLQAGEDDEPEEPHGLRTLLLEDVSSVLGVLEELDGIDACLPVIGIYKDRSELAKDELVDLLRHWPNPARLRCGPDLAQVSRVLGKRSAALQLFALGEFLDLWTVITPEKVGYVGDEARLLAGAGFAIISGFRAAMELEAIPA